MIGLQTVFYCIDDVGMSREVGQWLAVSVRSVLANTSLKPVVLYSGSNAENMDRLRAWGAEVKPCTSRLSVPIGRGIDEGVFPRHMAGALLRYEVDKLGSTEKYIMYADCDTYFFRHPVVNVASIDVVGACVTSRGDEGPHFNSGVIIFNVEAYCRQISQFFSFIEGTLGRWLPSSVDEKMFNAYFRKTINELPARINWRPFFGFNSNIDVVHFHGLQLTHTIFMLTRDYRGFERALLDSDYLPELASHRSRSLESAEGYLSLIASRGGFDKTDLKRLAEQLSALTTKQELCHSLMMSNAQLGKASREALKIARLVDWPNMSGKRVFYRLGLIEGGPRFQIHPCRNFGVGKMIIRDAANMSEFEIFCNEAIEFEKKVFNDRIEIYWGGVGLDCHFILVPNGCTARLNVEVAGLDSSLVVVSAHFASGELMQIAPHESVSGGRSIEDDSPQCPP